ncbi:MAG: hypothetical protein ACN6I0_00120 [Peredibacter sp.]
MKALVALLLLSSFSAFAEGEEVNLEFMNYEKVMAGLTPVEVDIPTEKERKPQSVVDFKRVPGKEVKRAPALEDIDARHEIGEAKYQ